VLKYLYKREANIYLTEAIIWEQSLQREAPRRT